MSPLGGFHLAAAVVALAAGAFVLLSGPKGGRMHKRVGWLYLAAMLALNGSALLIYRLFRGFGPFHVAALVSLFSILTGGALAILARRARQRGERERRAHLVAGHYRAIAWSYIGLLAALVSETATRLNIARPAAVPGREFAMAVAIATLAVVSVGAYLLRSRRDRLLAPFAYRPPAASRLDR